MPQIQPMYFHRHTYVVCQKSSCTPFIFSTEKWIYLLLQKYFISKDTRNFIEIWQKHVIYSIFPALPNRVRGKGQRLYMTLLDILSRQHVIHLFQGVFCFLTKDPWLSTFLCLCIQLSNADTPYQFSQNCSSTCWTCVTISCGEHARQVLFSLSS